MTRAPLRAAAFALLAVVGLSGCVRIHSDQAFSADNTVSQETILAFAPEVYQQLGFDPADFTPEAVADQGEGIGIDPDRVTIEEYVDGDLRGVRIVATDLTLEEFNSAATGGTNVLEGAPIGVPAITAERVDDEYVISIPASSGAAAAETQDIPIGLLGDSFDIELTFSFPGPVREASAGRVDGKTVTLGLTELAEGQEITIRAQATEGIAWEPILRWGGIALGALVIVGGAAALVIQDRRRHGRTSLPPPRTSDGTGIGVLSAEDAGESAPDDK